VSLFAEQKKATPKGGMKSIRTSLGTLQLLASSVFASNSLNWLRFLYVLTADANCPLDITD
jgi:hypothetical protein